MLLCNFDPGHGLNRWPGNDPQLGKNKFTTTRTQDSGSGTYSVSADGGVTLTSQPPDSETISGVLSTDGQTVIFGCKFKL